MTEFHDRAQRVIHELADNDEYGWAEAIRLITDLLDEVDKRTLTPAEEDAVATVRRAKAVGAGTPVRVSARSAFEGYSGFIVEVKPNGFVVRLTTDPGGRTLADKEVFFTPNEIEVTG